MSKFIDYATKIILYCENRNMDRVKTLIAEAEEYFLSTKEYKNIMRLYMEIQSQMENIGDVDLIVEYLIRFLVFYEDLNIEEHREYFFGTQGYLCYILCDYEGALEAGTHSLAESIKNNNTVSTIATLNNIAMIHAKMNDFKTAMEILLQSKELFEKYGMGDWFFKSNYLVTYAECKLMFQKFDEAKLALEEVTSLDSYSNSVLQKMDYSYMMGLYYYYIEEYELSLEYYRIAIDIAEKKNVFYEVQKMYLGIAQVLFKLEYIEESQIYKEKADEITRETLDHLNNSIIMKAHASIAINQKIQRAKLEDEKGTNVIKLDTNKFDELTEFVNKEYLFGQLNQLFKETEVSKYPYLLVIDITNVNEVIEDTSPIYGEKFIYEIAKSIRINVDDYIVGRIGPNKFMVVYSLMDNETVNDESKWLLRNLDDTLVNIKDHGYSIKYEYELIDLVKLQEKQETAVLDLFELFN